MNRQIQLPVNFYQEGDLVVATSPALEITTQDETFDEAKKNFEELVGIFFEEYKDINLLEKVLTECGWRKVENRMQSPVEIARVYQSIAMPEFAY